jgi:hypothetical protein
MEEGRSGSRRIEIVPHPRDLSHIAESFHSANCRIGSRPAVPGGIRHTEGLLYPLSFALWTSLLGNTYRDRAKRVSLRELSVIQIGVVHD